MNQYDHFKDKLHDYKVKVDKEKLWQQTAHAIPQRKRRRMILFFLFGGLGMASLWLGYTQYHSSTSGYIAAADQPDAALPLYDAITTTIQEAIPNADTNPDAKRGKPQKTKPVVQLIDNDPSISAETKQAGKTTGKNMYAASARNRQHLDEAELAGSKRKAGAKEETPRILKDVDVLNLKSTTGDQIPDTDEENAPVVGAFTLSRTVSSMTAPLPVVDKLTNLTIDDADQPNVPVIPAARKENAISFSMFAAAGISSFNIKPLNAVSDEAASLLKKHVRSLEHLSLDIAGSLPLSNQFTVETRIGWNRWTTETQQQTTTATPFTQEGVTTIRIDEEGVAHPVQGVVQGTHLSHKNLIRFTQYHTVDATLSLQRSLWRKNRMQVEAFATGSLVLLDQATGSTLNTEGEMWKFTAKENPFSLASKLSMGGGLRMHYHFTRHLSLCGTMGYHPVRYHLQQEDQKTEWTHSVFRGHLGMKYQY